MTVENMVGAGSSTEIRGTGTFGSTGIPDSSAPVRVILDDAQDLSLNTLLRMLAEGCRRLILAGAAGTGKTTVVLEIINRAVAAGWEVRLLAPTNRAALRMAETTGRPAQTIQSAQYRKFVETEDGELVMSDAQAVAVGRMLVVIDEASMLGSRLVADLDRFLPPEAAVLFMGDPYQLPPVKDTPGVDLTRPHAALTKVHRQAAGNPVLAYATAIREGWGPHWIGEWIQQIQAGMHDSRLQVVTANAALIAPWAVSNDTDRVVLTWMHRDRIAINHAALGEANPSRGFRAGLRIIIRENDKKAGLVNGDVLTVEACRMVGGTPAGPVIEIKAGDKKILIAPSAFDQEGTWKDIKSRFTTARGKVYPIIQCSWGWCLTVHQSQGSQWADVLLYLGDPQLLTDCRAGSQNAKLLYTAVTRARQSLVIALPG